MNEPVIVQNDALSLMNPIVPVQIGDEVYGTVSIVFDYNVIRTVLRTIGINPITTGLVSILNTEDGLERLFHAMATSFGPKQPIPEEQRAITIEQVRGWFEDIGLYTMIYSAIAEAFAAAMVKSKTMQAKLREGEKSDPPAKTPSPQPTS